MAFLAYVFHFRYANFLESKTFLSLFDFILEYWMQFIIFSLFGIIVRWRFARASWESMARESKAGGFSIITLPPSSAVFCSRGPTAYAIKNSESNLLFSLSISVRFDFWEMRMRALGMFSWVRNLQLPTFQVWYSWCKVNINADVYIDYAR